MKHVGTKTIETARLTLRRLKLTDAEMMYRNWTSDEKVTHFLRWNAHDSVEETKGLIQHWVDQYQADSTYYWGMYLKNGEMIGSIGITISSECDFQGSLGYKIGSRWWNQGYATEGASAVIDYMFRNTDIERIDSFASVENIASSKVMEKAGMRFEGLLRHYYKTRDGFHDCTVYGVIRNEWEQMLRSDG